MKSRAIVSIKVTDGWEWLLATTMGTCLSELIAAGSRSHNQNRLSPHLYTFFGSEELSSSIKLAASAVLNPDYGSEGREPLNPER